MSEFFGMPNSPPETYPYLPPVYSFQPNTFSFHIDSNDEKLKRTLRRSSLTGLCAHPISRQLSNKVDIPVEHSKTNSSRVGITSKRAIQTTRITLPEYPEHETNAKKSEKSKSSSKKQITKKTSPIRVHHVPNTSRSKLHAPLNEKNNATGATEKSSSYDQIDYDPKKYEAQWSLNSPTTHKTNLGEKCLSTQYTDDDVNNTLIRNNLKQLALKKTNLSIKCDKLDEHKSRREYEEEIKKQDEFMEKEYKFYRFLIIPDGNCIYRAVAQAVLLDQSEHMTLRQLVIDHIREHRDEFETIIEEDIEVFLLTAQLEGEWGGYPEILALSRLLDININITTGGTASNPNVHTRIHYFEKNSDKSETKLSEKEKNKGCTRRSSIWLSWLSSGHYDTFLEKKMENPCYEEWLQSRESRIQSDAAIASQLHSDDLSKRNSETFQDDYKDTQKKVRPDYFSNSDGYTANTGSYINTDFHEKDYEIDQVLAPHVYPDSTYARTSAHSKNEKSLPPYSSLNSSTELDEAIALSLQKEEDMNEEKLKSYLA